jgi:hypothetical protein
MRGYRDADGAMKVIKRFSSGHGRLTGAKLSSLPSWEYDARRHGSAFAIAHRTEVKEPQGRQKLFSQPTKAR